MKQNTSNMLVPTKITMETLKTKIHIIRGQKVMLAADLAEIYGYSTKAFNQQVRNNIEKFDEDFRFQLTWDEVEELSRSNFLTLNKGGRGGNLKYLPWCFTESGVYMLMTVLKGELATQQSKMLIRTFMAMKDYISQDPLISDASTITRLSLQRTGGKFHDRYIIIDYKCRSEKVYHCGSSSKDAGNKITTISKSDNKALYHPMIDDLLSQPALRLR